MSSVVGANLLVFLNGRLVGEVVGVQWVANTPNVLRRGLDSLTAYSIDPTAADVSGTISVVRQRGTGGLEGRGLVAPFRHIPREKYFSILITDRTNGKKMYQADYCKVTSQTWSNVAKQRVEGNFSFVGIEFSNESDAGYQ